MENKQQFERLVGGLEWLSLIAEKSGTCTIDKVTIDAYLFYIKALVDENKKLTQERNDFKVQAETLSSELEQTRNEYINESCNHDQCYLHLKELENENTKLTVQANTWKLTAERVAEKLATVKEHIIEEYHSRVENRLEYADDINPFGFGDNDAIRLELKNENV
jgi:hypothetical protein